MARGLALLALAAAAGAIGGVLSTSGSSSSRNAESVARRLKTGTVAGHMRVITVTRASQPTQATRTAVTFMPLHVRRFGFTAEIPAGWHARTQQYAHLQLVWLRGPGGATMVIDRTAPAPAPAQLDQGSRTLSSRGLSLSGTRWRFAARFCHPVCSDWIGASRDGGYAVLIYSDNPTLVREATVVARSLHEQR